MLVASLFVSPDSLCASLLISPWLLFVNVGSWLATGKSMKLVIGTCIDSVTVCWPISLWCQGLPSLPLLLTVVALCSGRIMLIDGQGLYSCCQLFPLPSISRLYGLWVLRECSFSQARAGCVERLRLTMLRVCTNVLLAPQSVYGQSSFTTANTTLRISLLISLPSIMRWDTGSCVLGRLVIWHRQTSIQGKNCVCSQTRV